MCRAYKEFKQLSSKNKNSSYIQNWENNMKRLTGNQQIHENHVTASYPVRTVTRREKKLINANEYTWKGKF